jgi:hypothetical protein
MSLMASSTDAGAARTTTTRKIALGAIDIVAVVAISLSGRGGQAA